MFEVVAIGKGHYDKRTDKIAPLPIGLKVGDRILANVGVCKKIKIGGEEYYTCPNAEEAIVILEEGETI